MKEGVDGEARRGNCDNKFFNGDYISFRRQAQLPPPTQPSASWGTPSFIKKETVLMHRIEKDKGITIITDLNKL